MAQYSTFFASGSAEKVAEFTLGLLPRDYVDVDWLRLLRLALTIGRGFAGIMPGDAIEEAYRGLLGGMTLGEMPIPAYAPVWNVEQNRVEYLGPRTYPELPVARAVHMAIALPLFIQPVEFGGFHWCDVRWADHRNREYLLPTCSRP